MRYETKTFCSFSPSHSQRSCDFRWWLLVSQGRVGRRWQQGIQSFFLFFFSFFQAVRCHMEGPSRQLSVERVGRRRRMEIMWTWINFKPQHSAVCVREKWRVPINRSNRGQIPFLAWNWRQSRSSSTEFVWVVGESRNTFSRRPSNCSPSFSLSCCLLRSKKAPNYANNIFHHTFLDNFRSKSWKCHATAITLPKNMCSQQRNQFLISTFSSSSHTSSRDRHCSRKSYFNCKTVDDCCSAARSSSLLHGKVGSDVNRSFANDCWFSTGSTGLAW